MFGLVLSATKEEAKGPHKGPKGPPALHATGARRRGADSIHIITLSKYANNYGVENIFGGKELIFHQKIVLFSCSRNPYDFQKLFYLNKG